MLEEIKLTMRTKSGTLIRVPAVLEYTGGRILFHKSPFALKDEIKVMRGSHWHGRDEHNPRKIWSVEDCPRNRFQLGFLTGEDVYQWFDRPLERHTYETLMRDGRPAAPMPHQCDLADHGLTYHFGVWAAEMGVGKTLAAQLVIERSGVKHWYWIGPKTSLPNIRREFKLWGFDFDGDIEIEFITYERLVRVVDEWSDGNRLPGGVIFDESSRLKGATSQRTKAAQRLADMIRAAHGLDGYVIEMSGTPSPKSPKDWWSQCEIAWPGFLREGSCDALEKRLAFTTKTNYEAGVFSRRLGWRDDERKCDVCGQYQEEGPHDLDGEVDPADFHKFVPSTNEVAYMHERLQGLVIIKHKKDCLSLPDKRYRKVYCPPSGSILRVAKALADTAPNAITGMTWLRELSDGFQYRQVADGTTRCTHCPPGPDGASGQVEEWFDPTDEERSFEQTDMLRPEIVARLVKRLVDCPQCHGTGQMPKTMRIVREVPCPKEAALKSLLDENEETGRLVVFAGFTGSVDRATAVCRRAKWDVVRCDGRGLLVFTHDGKIVSGASEPLDYWADLAANPRVAFVAHPESGGMSLTLVEARMAVYWSNSFKPEYRSQSEDRIHRKGMDENLGCTIVDLIHLPSDERVISVLQENRKLELMTMGEFSTVLSTAA